MDTQVLYLQERLRHVIPMKRILILKDVYKRSYLLGVQIFHYMANTDISLDGGDHMFHHHNRGISNLAFISELNEEIPRIRRMTTSLSHDFKLNASLSL